MNPFPITPVGTKLIIEQLDKEEETSTGGLYMANSSLSKGRVVAVAKPISDVYKVGDIILYPTKKGVEEPIAGKAYKWLDAEPNLGEIWGIETKYQPQQKDKGDSL